MTERVKRSLPADNRRTCGKCGRQFRRERGTNRKNCFTCAPSRALSAVPEAPAAPEREGPGPIEAQALARLEEAGRVDSIEGQALLVLAREADSGRITGSQLGTLAEKLLKVASVALAGAKSAKPDRLDEVAARRLAKASAAS